MQIQEYGNEEHHIHHSVTELNNLTGYSSGPSNSFRLIDSVSQW